MSNILYFYMFKMHSMYSIPLWTLIYSYSKVCLSVFKASNIYCIYCSWALASPVLACSGRMSTISACMPLNNVSRPCNNTAVLSDCMGWWLVVLHFIVSTSHTRKDMCTNTDTHHTHAQMWLDVAIPLLQPHLPPVGIMTILRCTASRTKIKWF